MCLCFPCDSNNEQLFCPHTTVTKLVFALEAPFIFFAVRTEILNNYNLDEPTALLAPLFICLLSPLTNVLSSFQPTITRRSSGCCLASFIDKNLCPYPITCSASHFGNTSSISHSFWLKGLNDSSFIIFPHYIL
jgi:hypothetical protein